MSKELFKKLIVSLLLLYSISVLVYILTHSDQYQWDFKIYYYAAKIYAAGLNPYDKITLAQTTQSPTNFPFVYPPVTLFFFQLFSLVDYNTAFYLFLTFKSILLIGLIYLWRKEFLVEIDLLFYFFCLLAFNSAIYLDIRAGNISILEQFIIWLGLFFYLKRKLLLFCLFILIAAVYKIVPILLLFFLWFSKEKNRHIYFIGSFILFLLIMLISYMASPLLFVGFVSNASTRLEESGVVNPSTLQLIKDSFELLAYKTGIVVPNGAQFLLYFVVIGIVLFVTWRAFIVLQSVKVRDKERIELFLACLVYALILPRFKDYSYIFLLVPTYFIIKKDHYIKAYPFLFIITILSVHNITLPGFDIIFNFLWRYYPLIVAYGVWSLYLYEIFVIIKKPITTIKYNSE